MTAGLAKTCSGQIYANCITVPNIQNKALVGQRSYRHSPRLESYAYCTLFSRFSFLMANVHINGRHHGASGAVNGSSAVNGGVDHKTSNGSSSFSAHHHVEPMKYIVVTGGVVSGLGKGVTISSIGRMLKNCGLRTTSIKIDPYLVSV